MDEQVSGSEPARPSQRKYEFLNLVGLGTAIASMMAAIAAALAASSANEISRNELLLSQSSVRPIVEIEKISGNLYEGENLSIAFRLANRGQTAAKIESAILTVSAYHDSSKTVALDSPVYIVLIGPPGGKEILANAGLDQTSGMNFPLGLREFPEARSFIGEFEIFYSFGDDIKSQKVFSDRATGIVAVEPR